MLVARLAAWGAVGLSVLGLMLAMNYGDPFFAANRNKRIRIKSKGATTMRAPAPEKQPAMALFDNDNHHADDDADDDEDGTRSSCSFCSDTAI